MKEELHSIIQSPDAMKNAKFLKYGETTIKYLHILYSLKSKAVGKRIFSHFRAHEKPSPDARQSVLEIAKVDEAKKWG